MKIRPRLSHHLGSLAARRLLPIVAALLCVAGFSSCASDDPGNMELQAQLDRRNAEYANRMERRTMRRVARDDRYDAWFDMVMY